MQALNRQCRAGVPATHAHHPPAQLGLASAPRLPTVPSYRRSARRILSCQAAQDEGGTKVDWVTFFAPLASCGALSGTLLDGIHSRTGLQVYDVLPVKLGGLFTSAAVPPLLALFYVMLGGLVVWSDTLVGKGDAATVKAQQRSQGIEYVALCFGVLAAELQVSAWAYSTEMPFNEIFILLATVSAISWFLLDGTKQGLALAAVCAVGAPAAELVLLHFVPLWHYPSGDILDGAFVSWVPWCYFFYTPALSALARYLYHTASMEPPTNNPQQ